MIRAIGLDAGREVGWGSVEVRGDGTATWLGSGVLRRDRRMEDLAYVLRDEGPDLALVAVEIPSGHVYKGHDFATPALVEAARIGGEIVGLCRSQGLTVVECSARDWRKALCSNASATDAAVKTMCRLRIGDLPKVTNSHERDAMGAAIWAALRSMRSETRRAS